MTRPAELAGRWLEPWSNPGPRGMAVGAARLLQNPAYRPASHIPFCWLLRLLPPRNRPNSLYFSVHWAGSVLKVLLSVSSLHPCFFMVITVEIQARKLSQ